MQIQGQAELLALAEEPFPQAGMLRLQEGAEHTLVCGKGSYKSQSLPVYLALAAKRRYLSELLCTNKSPNQE